MTLVPGGRGSDVQLKSNGPLSWASIDIQGLRQDFRSRCSAVVVRRSS